MANILNKRALISVYDKNGLIILGNFLKSLNIEIISSSKTAQLLNNSDIKCTEITEYIDFPEILDGRVKTLHPKIYGGILNKRDNPNHHKDLVENNISNIDIVIVNLYPFEENNTIENIDIGGVSLIRAAAKNYKDILVVTDVNDYDFIINNFDKLMSVDDSNLRKRFAAKAFHHIAKYDILIAKFLSESTEFDNHDIEYKIYKKQDELKYGCNPHQKNANIYMDILNNKNTPFKILNGKPGYINYLDAINSWLLVKETSDVLSIPVCASFKHTSPAGVGTSRALNDHLKEIYNVKDKELTNVAISYVRAKNSDPLSSFGDFIAMSHVVDECTALLIKKDVSDGIVAPGYSKEALEILKNKKKGNFIILEARENYDYNNLVEFREISGLVLSQDNNKIVIDHNVFKNDKIVTKNKYLDYSVICDMILSNITLKYTPSNSIAFAYDGQVIGIGAGQQNRVDCVKLAGNKVRNWLLRQNRKIVTDEEAEILIYPNMVMASDAFFPFKDNIEVANEFGVKYITQPGGSIRDDEVIEECNKNDMVMLNTGIRLFTH
jgi:phosphoribosylaminoimidazolecarboxamide formyltransferase/IMP cyclohydrolase